MCAVALCSSAAVNSASEETSTGGAVGGGGIGGSAGGGGSGGCAGATQMERYMLETLYMLTLSSLAKAERVGLSAAVVVALCVAIETLRRTSDGGSDS